MRRQCDNNILKFPTSSVVVHYLIVDSSLVCVALIAFLRDILIIS